MQLRRIVIFAVICGVPACALSAAQTATEYSALALEKARGLHIGDAIEAMSQAIKLEPNNPKWYQQRGDFKAILATTFGPLSAKKDDEGSIADFDEVIRLDPGSEDAYLGKSRVHAALGDSKAAIADLEQLLKIKPGEPVGYGSRARLKLEQKDADGALADFNKAIELTAKDSAAVGWYLYGRSAAWTAKGDANRATADLDQAIALSQGDKDALPLMYADRASARLARGDQAGSLADLDSYLALKTDDEYTYVKRGELRRARENTEGALEDFEKALKIDQDHPRALYGRALIQLAQGKWKEAIKDLESYSDSVPSPDDYIAFYFFIADKRSGSADAAAELEKYAAGWTSPSGPSNIAAFLLGKRSEAEFLAEAGKADPSQIKARLTDAHFYIGIVKALAGDSPGARASFEKAIAQDLGPSYDEYFLAQAELARLK